MKFLIAIFFAFSASSLLAQLTEPVSGKPYSTEKKENFSGFIGENATCVYAIDYLYISRRKQELNVRKFFKSDLQLIDSKNIFIDPEGDYYSEPSEVFFQNNKIYLFSILTGEKDNPTLVNLEIFNDNMERMSSGIVDTLDL